MQKILGFLFFLTLFLLTDLSASETENIYDSETIANLKRIIVLDTGRYKPLDTYAREINAQIFKRTTVERKEPVIKFLEIVFENEKYTKEKIFKVENLEIKKFFDSEGGERVYVSAEEFLHNREVANIIQSLSGRKPQTRIEKSIRDLHNRVSLLLNVEMFFVKSLIYSSDKEKNLKTMSLYDRLKESFLSRDKKYFKMAVLKLREHLNKVDGVIRVPEWKLEAEIFFNSFNPFRNTLIAYCVTFIFGLINLLLRKKIWAVITIIFLVCGLLLNLLGCVLNLIIAERPPYSNLFETLTFISFLAALLAFIFELVKKGGYWGFAGSVVGLILLFFAITLPVNYKTVVPLQAVLVSYWLHFHVAAMCISYASMFLAAVIAVFFLVAYLKYKANLENPEVSLRVKKFDEMTYKIIQVGFLFLTVGIMLGALWANESWGRYWGWDPKETASLITWLIYVVYLHGRVVGWMKGSLRGIFPLIGVLAVVFTYYGVNFLIQGGLHTYSK